MRGFVRDEGLRQAINEAGGNYWDVYIEEILGLLGASATAISLAQLDDPAEVAGFTSLIIGRQSGCQLGPAARENLQAWVAGGGLLIGFGVPNLDDIFGVEFTGMIRQRPDEYAISAYFDFALDSLTREIHPRLFLEQQLLILSEVRQVTAGAATPLARLYDADHRLLDGAAAISWRRYGAGHAGYFAFDVAKTCWLLHQGRPIPALPEDESHSRSCHLTVVGANSTKVAYADEMALVVQNMLALDGAPFIYQIPPDDGAVADALFYWIGDEYFGPAELSVQASDFMRELGLPYHINIGIEQTPGAEDGHPMTPEEWRHIRDNGHEVSLWFNMPRDGEAYVITEERLRRQSDLFFKRFGSRPVCTLLHNCNWRGWAEPARWMAAAGVRADNSFFGSNLPRRHSYINSTNYAFAFGTGYPYFFYDDAGHGNARIPLIEEPMTCYELGHRGTIGHALGLVDRETATLEDLPLPIDMALKYHQVINMFYHPTYIVEYPRCREAIREILRYLAYRGGRVVHMGGDAAADWWMARDASTIDDVRHEEGGVTFRADCAYGGGMVVRLPLPDDGAAAVRCDGQSLSHEVRTEFGRRWLLAVLPPGDHRVEVRQSQPVEPSAAE